MKISTNTEWELLDAIETGGYQIEMAVSVLEEVMEGHFDDTDHWKYLAMDARRISNLLTVVHSLLLDAKNDLFKVRDDFTSEEAKENGA